MSTALPVPGTASSDDLGPETVLASWLLTALAALFLTARIGAKLWTRRGLWVDDYVLIMAWITLLAPAITSTFAVSKGLGKHVYNITSNPASLALLLNVTVTILIIAAALSKTSFAITVLRIVKGWMNVTTWVILVSTNIFLGINVVILWVNFNPAPSAAPPSPSMISLQHALQTYGLFATVYSAAMDFALVTMAWFVVSRLQMRSTREKLGVGIAMSMGVFAGATSIVKAVILLDLSTGDISYTSATLHMWSFAEPSVTIIAASIPLLRILVTHVKHMTIRTGATKLDQSTFGVSLGTSEKRTMTSTQVGTQGRGDAMRLANLGVDDMSDEDMMLEDLREVPMVELANNEQKDVDQAEERSEEQAVRATPHKCVRGEACEEVY